VNGARIALPPVPFAVPVSGTVNGARIALPPATFLATVPVHTQSIVRVSNTPCRFKLKCTKGESCPFFHGVEDGDMTPMEFYTQMEAQEMGIDLSAVVDTMAQEEEDEEELAAAFAAFCETTDPASSWADIEKTTVVHEHVAWYQAGDDLALAQ
jgi:hypothetical protein